jgi:hypothetical protein
VETRRSVEYEEWQTACRIEREAWAKVTGKLPGSPAHDHNAWTEWQKALQQSTDALDRYLKSRNELRRLIDRKLPSSW